MTPPPFLFIPWYILAYSHFDDKRKRTQYYLESFQIKSGPLGKKVIIIIKTYTYMSRDSWR